MPIYRCVVRMLSLFQQFNAFMKGVKSDNVVTNILQKVDDHLAASGTTFLEGESLSYTDCFLLPRLQHIIVAGKVGQAFSMTSLVTPCNSIIYICLDYLKHSKTGSKVYL